MSNTITKRATGTSSTAATLPMQKAKPPAPRTTAQNYFSRKIGNTTFVVSVSFNEKATESMNDKILRLVASDIQQGVEQQCS